MTGTLRRLAKLFDSDSSKSLVLALDHGARQGMLPGLSSMPQIVDGLATRRVQGVMLNKGFARVHTMEIPLEMTMIVQLCGGTKHGEPPYSSALVCSPSEAARLGADAVGMHINIGNEYEDRMLADLGLTTDDAHQLGLPVLATICPRGRNVVNELDPHLIAHCIRVGAEMGVDLVSVPYSGHAESFAEAVEASPSPVLVTGGPSQPDFDSFLAMLKEALSTGAAGVCVGRNIFEHTDPLAKLDAVIELVHG
ncbi:deoxyribose-phosphate aldolase/phospho-2-dehydro-3-deoxyheptonate aldolase [Desulfovibrio sp. X2]|uniref:class I fructose-bisphosphate aldolase n=1 Tax=Desulfovibrio sp. X2 TaxID=941449 RepID=UPI000358C16B|nr:2-amino-3,7-dideoxy-D-threo-hept-6-ulosonate synthase [Desulfovibrio sp. X2]EPR43809.1 deoxyribose-phosphate aldolase/phospho-2-dehydro-3-deoxyheptonate aldolase [Desulfovibrio sp. X2]